MMTRTQARKEAMDRMWGADNDARLWDGWRTYGDAWAARYCAAQLQRGVDLRGHGTPRATLIEVLRAEPGDDFDATDES